MKTFDNYKFRCSQLGKLMVEPRSKSEKLSETTKSYLKGLWIKEVYGRERFDWNKFIEKGKYCEEDGIDLVTRKFGKLFVKSKKEYQDEFLVGHVDLETKTEVLDIKCSWDIFTFMNADGTNMDYWWQGQGYLWLTGKKEFKLCYCLCNAPEHLIVAEKNYRHYKQGIEFGTEESVLLEADVEREMTFDDIPEQDRLKCYSFQADQHSIDNLIARIGECRIYMNSLHL